MTTLLTQSVSRKILRKLNITTALGLVVLTAGAASTGVFAAANSNFAQTINNGALTLDIVDANRASVANPSVGMADTNFSFACQSTTGIFGTTTEKIYVRNPDAADGGWAVSLAAADGASAKWTSASKNSSYDFNDANGAGCTDGDTDGRGGQMTVNPSAGEVVAGPGLAPSVTGITKGSSQAFGATNSISLLTGALNSDDIGSWELTGVNVTQTIPAEQDAAADYKINMVLSIIGVQ